VTELVWGLLVSLPVAAIHNFACESQVSDCHGAFTSVRPGCLERLRTAPKLRQTDGILGYFVLFIPFYNV
jgi:hypothetical protein